MPVHTGGQRSAIAVRTLHATMKKVGLSEVCVEVYMRLLVGGTATAARLRQANDLREADVLEATRELRRMGLIVAYRHKGKTAWYCADPATAWLSLAADITWSATATLSPIDQLPTTGVSDVDARSTLYRAALRPALQLWNRDVPEMRQSREARSASTLAQLAVEAVRVARSRVRSISASPKISGAAQFWPALVERMRAGVQYTRLADLNEVYEHGLDVVRRDLSAGVNLFIGLQDELTLTRGYISDNRILVRYEEAPPGCRPESGFMTSDRYAIERFAQRFDRLAASAVPAVEAVGWMEEYAQILRRRAEDLSEEGRDWLEELIGMGRFSTKAVALGWAQERSRLIERELTDAGVAARSKYGHLLPNWPDPTEVTRSLQESGARHTG